MKTYGQYCYVVTEGGGGMQIISLVNPEAPTLVSTYGAGLWSNAHTISVDETAQLLYVNGTNNGMRIVSVANPTSPSLIATYSTDYVHDCHPQNGRVHLAEIYDGRYRILDVDSLPSMPTLDSVITPGQFTHNVWVNATDRIACTTDENQGGRMTIYDVSNPSNIVQRATWTIHANSTIHNVHLRGNRAHCAWYTQGYVCVDVSDPAQPALVGSYDTNSRTGTGYEGAWGCYPFSPSGVVYVSDIENGLYVLEVNDLGTDAVLLDVPDSGNVGVPVNFRIFGGIGGSNWILYWSRNLNGTVINGQPFDIGTPFQTLASGVTNANGDANFTSGPVPPAAAGRTFHLEARVDGAQTLDSNPETIVFQ
jgi:hypothetical protein